MAFNPKAFLDNSHKMDATPADQAIGRCLLKRITQSAETNMKESQFNAIRKPLNESQHFRDPVLQGVALDPGSALRLSRKRFYRSVLLHVAMR